MLQRAPLLAVSEPDQPDDAPSVVETMQRLDGEIDTLALRQCSDSDDQVIDLVG